MANSLQVLCGISHSTHAVDGVDNCGKDSGYVLCVNITVKISYQRAFAIYSGDVDQFLSSSSSAHLSSSGTSQGAIPSTPFLLPHWRNPAHTLLLSRGSFVTKPEPA